MFIAALLATAKIWKLPNVSVTRQMDKGRCGIDAHTHKHTRTYIQRNISHKKMKFYHLQQHG